MKKQVRRCAYCGQIKSLDNYRDTGSETALLYKETICLKCSNEEILAQINLNQQVINQQLKNHTGTLKDGIWEIDSNPLMVWLDS